MYFRAITTLFLFLLLETAQPAEAQIRALETFFGRVRNALGRTGRQAEEEPTTPLEPDIYNSRFWQFDPTRKPSRKDKPNRAGRIVCTGQWPEPWEWPLDLSFDPSTLSIQQICAKPAYGGHAGAHVGGWCFPGSGRSGLLRQVVFDSSELAGVNHQLSSLRLELFCMQQCWCDARYSLRPPRQPLLKTYTVGQTPNRQTFKIDWNYGVSWPPENLRMGTRQGDTRSLSVQHIQQAGTDNQAVPPNYEMQPVGLNPHNYITCDGPLPSFPFFPEPWVAEDYHNLLQLCAAPLAGGSIHASAGMICAAAPTAPHRRFVWTTDEFTPAESFKVRTPVGFFLKLYCSAWCNCMSREDQILDEDDPHIGTNKVIEWAGGMRVDVSNGGLVAIRSSNGVMSSTTLVPPLTYPGLGREKICSVEGGLTEACAAQLEKTEGKAMDWTEVEATLLEADVQLAALNQAVSCGAGCLSNSDCTGRRKGAIASALTGGGCKCMVSEDPPPGVRVFDPVSPKAYCLSSALLGSSRTRKLPNMRAIPGALSRGLGVDYGLGKRGELGIRWGCPCNVTYISRACCDVDDGYVWEEGEKMNLGVLEL